jgi:hypothetical protein
MLLWWVEDWQCAAGSVFAMPSRSFFPTIFRLEDVCLVADVPKTII